MRVTSKGQVTIPQKVREQLGIKPGSEVAFHVDAHGARLVRVSPGDGEALAGAMRGLATVAMSTDEIMALTRAED
jgi:AbrB family looped-hinge helix DNA binding protein